MRRLLPLCGLLLFTGCLTAWEDSDATRSGVWGYVRLVPREGVEIGGASGAYGDRRLSGVEMVDYSRPGFVVVYAEGAPLGGESQPREIAIRTGKVGLRFDPSRLAVARGDRISLQNDSGADQLVSCPGLGLVETVPAGDSLEISVDEPGELRVFLLSAPNVESIVFAAPGPYAVVSRTGRFEITGLAPGRTLLRAWHPRFPPTSSWVEISSGSMTRSDLELGVDQLEESGDASD